MSAAELLHQEVQRLISKHRIPARTVAITSVPVIDSWNKPVKGDTVLSLRRSGQYMIATMVDDNRVRYLFDDREEAPRYVIRLTLPPLPAQMHHPANLRDRAMKGDL